MWASTTTGGFPGNSFLGVTTYSTTTLNWTMSFSSSSWNGNHSYAITSKSQNVPARPSLKQPISKPSRLLSIPPLPSRTIVSPPAQLYISTLSALTANITDIAAGQVSNVSGKVYFYVAKQQFGTSNFWDWTMSTFTASGTNIQLVAPPPPTGTYNSGTWSYSTTTFQTAGATWLNGGQYEIQVFAQDLAGNQNAPTTWDFTYETTAPTATIVVPQYGLTAVNSLTISSGTALDTFQNANVKIAIYSPSDPGWFDGSGFTIIQSTPILSPGVVSVFQ